MGFVDDFLDDVVGLDPNGGGLYDVPVIGDIIDDTLGIDPGDSGINKLLKIAGWATLGTAAAGAAGVGPLAGTAEAIKSGASITDILPSWSSLTGAEQTAVTNGLSNTSALSGITGPELLSGINTAASVGSSVLGGIQQTGGGDSGFWSTVGNIAGAVGNVAGAVGAGAEVYDALTGEGAEANREHLRRTVADVAPLTALQQEGIQSGIAGARDPRLGQAQDRLYNAQGQGAGALTTGLDTLSGIATGDDAYTQRLGRQAAGLSDLSASGQGVLGGARAERAKQTSVADVIAGRQQSAAGTLASRGQGLLGQGSQAYNLGQAPGTTLRNLGSIQQQQAQTELNQEAAREAAGGRTPTTAERVSQVAGGLEALPTAYDQGRQGVNSLISLFE